MVQQGAVRACLKVLNSDGLSDKIVDRNRQTLARLLMITNPSLVSRVMVNVQRWWSNICVFRGQIDNFLVKDSIRHLMQFIRTNDSLYEFEGLMALTTVATLDNETKHLIVTSGEAIDQFEKLQMSDHNMVRRVRTPFLSHKAHPCAR